MAQDAVGGVVAPDGGLFRAWLDVLVHPKFATFQRWYLRMRLRWRMLSLIVSLVLILITACAGIALAAYSTMHTADAIAPGNLFAYLTAPNGLSRAIFYGPCAIVTLFAMPAAVALISPRRLGPYSIRFKRVFRPWMQVQPIICLLQLFSAVAQLVLLLIGVDATESFLSESFLSGLMTVTLVVAPLLGTRSYSVAALSAGGGRKPFLTGLVATIPGILALAAFGFAHSAVLK